MVKKSDYERAWDRWNEEVDPTEFPDQQTAWDAFVSWLNKNAGKQKGLDAFQEFFAEKWQEMVESLPPEDAAWFKFSEKVKEKPETKEKLRSAYEKALKQPNLKSAWGKYWGSLPYELRKSKHSKTLWQEIRKRYIK